MPIEHLTALYEALSHMTRLGLLALVLSAVFFACYRFIPRNNIRLGLVAVGLVVFISAVILIVLGQQEKAVTIKGNCNATANGDNNNVSSDCGQKNR